MPWINYKQPDKDGNTGRHVTKKELKAIRHQQAGSQWNPAANGKIVRQPDGTVFEILPSGWKRRRDIEAQIALKSKTVKLITETDKEIKYDDGKDKLSISIGKSESPNPGA